MEIKSYIKKLKLLFVLLFVISLFFSGCASSIKYKFDKNLYTTNNTMHYRVLIDIFEDVRPQEEHDRTFIQEKRVYTSGDNMFKGNISQNVTLMLAKHLMKVKIFDKVEVEDVSNDLEQRADEMQSLATKGIDLVILGNLKHFYGYQSPSYGGLLVCLGPLGPLMEAAANPKTVGGEVEYAGIKIVDLREKKILWRGNINYTFEEKDIFYDGSPAYALRALKEVNNKFSQRVDRELRKEMGTLINK